MTFRTATSALALTLGFSTGSAMAAGHVGTMGYALGDEGASLIVMSDLAAPTEFETYELSQPLDGLAYRPVTGDLLGLADGMIVTIDPATGELTDLGATFADDATIGADAAVGFDFNNAIDAVRAVSSTGDNLVYFPEGFGDNDERANSVRRFTDLAYGEGDANAGATPEIFANAYTNAINGETASETFQYALDAGTDSLVSLANNEGTLTTVGPVTIDGETADLLPMGGFDIVSAAEGENKAYAILHLDGMETSGLYTIDLTSGAASLIADLGVGGLQGFAASTGAM